MGLTEIFLLGVGLAMDCFAVSLAKGIAARRFYASGALLMALFFGLFQAGMPLIGYFAGIYFAGIIGKISPWIALVLLSFIGGKMVWEHFHPDAEEDADADYSMRTISVLSIATSIDALSTGLIFVSSPEVLSLAVAVIGVCSFVLSLVATAAGVKFGRTFNFPAELVGGIILICIGLKIWAEGFLL